MDSISSDLVEEFYKDGKDLKARRRLTAIVGASYLLHLRSSSPEKMTESENNLLDSLLEELGVSPDKAIELFQEIEEKGSLDLFETFSGDS